MILHTIGSEHDITFWALINSEISKLEDKSPVIEIKMKASEFIVRLKAQIDKRLNESGMQKIALKGCDNYDDYEKIWRRFFDSLNDINFPTNEIVGNL